MFPISLHRLILTLDHQFIDGLVPRIHVDTVDDSSFDDAGDGIPRSGAVPKSTAGSTPLEEDTVPSLNFDEHEERRGIKTRGEHEERRAMRAGVNVMPIGRKHRWLELFGIRWRRRPNVTYKQKESVAAR